MPENFRPSQYVNFNDDTIIDTPDSLFGRMPQPLSVEDKISLFESRVDAWQLGPAVAILKQIEASTTPSVWSHSGYTLVWVLTSYFEMIGKVLNLNSRSSGTAGDDFKAGFRDVYPDYTVAGSDGTLVPDVREQHVWSAVRNGIYHLGYTKSGIVLRTKQSGEDDFAAMLVPIGKSPTGTIHRVVLAIDPHSLTRTIVNHFPTFIARLRDTTQTALRAKFVEVIDNFHQTPAPKPVK